MWSRSTKQRRAAMRRREGFVRDGEYWVPKHPPTEWVPLSARYLEFFRHVLCGDGLEAEGQSVPDTLRDRIAAMPARLYATQDDPPKEPK